MMKQLYLRIVQTLTYLLYKRTVLVLFVLLVLGTITTVASMRYFTTHLIEYPAQYNRANRIRFR